MHKAALTFLIVLAVLFVLLILLYFGLQLCTNRSEDKQRNGNTHNESDDDDDDDNNPFSKLGFLTSKKHPPAPSEKKLKPDPIRVPLLDDNTKKKKRTWTVRKKTKKEKMVAAGEEKEKLDGSTKMPKNRLTFRKKPPPALERSRTALELKLSTPSDSPSSARSSKVPSINATPELQRRRAATAAGALPVSKLVTIQPVIQSAVPPATEPLVEETVSMLFEPSSESADAPTSSQYDVDDSWTTEVARTDYEPPRSTIGNGALPATMITINLRHSDITAMFSCAIARLQNVLLPKYGGPLATHVKVKLRAQPSANVKFNPVKQISRTIQLTDVDFEPVWMQFPKMVSAQLLTQLEVRITMYGHYPQTLSTKRAMGTLTIRLNEAIWNGSDVVITKPLLPKTDIIKK